MSTKNVDNFELRILNYEVGGRETRILFLSGDTDIFVKAWCVGVLNTDCTDVFWEHGYSLLMRDA